MNEMKKGYNSVVKLKENFDGEVYFYPKIGRFVYKHEANDKRYYFRSGTGTTTSQYGLIPVEKIPEDLMDRLLNGTQEEIKNTIKTLQGWVLVGII